MVETATDTTAIAATADNTKGIELTAERKEIETPAEHRRGLSRTAPNRP